MTATRLHALACPTCRAGLGRPTGLLSHHRVKLASDYAADAALAALRREQRERETTRKAVLLMAVHGYVRRGEG